MEEEQIISLQMPSETKKKIEFIIGKKATVRTTAYVKIFLKGADDKLWMNSNVEGYLVLIFSRNFKAPYLRVYHPITCQCLFDCAMNHNFNSIYIRAHELFHYFCIPHGFVGFSFADAKQAKKMGKQIKQISIKKKTEPKQYNQYLKKGVIIGKLKEKYVKKRKVVTKFKHVGGYTICVDENGLKDMSKLPQAYKNILKKANITKA